MIFLSLFLEYFKVGLFSVGGGLATLPFIYELKDKTGWFTTSDIINMIAVSESTPGPMGVNMATYVGNIVAGIPGGIVSTLGLIAPSIIIIIIVAHFLAKFKDSWAVQAIMRGLKPASMGLIVYATLSVARVALLDTEAFAKSGRYIDILDYKALILGSILFIMMRKTKLHPIIYVLIAALVGIIFQF